MIAKFAVLAGLATLAAVPPIARAADDAPALTPAMVAQARDALAHAGTALPSFHSSVARANGKVVIGWNKVHIKSCLAFSGSGSTSFAAHDDVGGVWTTFDPQLSLVLSTVCQTGNLTWFRVTDAAGDWDSVSVAQYK